MKNIVKTLAIIAFTFSLLFAIIGMVVIVITGSNISPNWYNNIGRCILAYIVIVALISAFTYGKDILKQINL